MLPKTMMGTEKPMLDSISLLAATTMLVVEWVVGWICVLLLLQRNRRVSPRCHGSSGQNGAFGLVMLLDMAPRERHDGCAGTGEGRDGFEITD
jgi:hypothetical protein